MYFSLCLFFLLPGDYCSAATVNTKTGIWGRTCLAFVVEEELVEELEVYEMNSLDQLQINSISSLHAAVSVKEGGKCA